MKTWLALTCIAFSSIAFAHTSKAPEKYSATDDTGSVIEPDDAADSSDNATAEAITPPPAPVKSIAVAQPAPAPKVTPIAAVKPVAVAAAAPAKAPALKQPSTSLYDRVPQDQVDPLLTRLQLVEEIVRRYGRAYDYRTHTVRELEAILQQLKLASLEAKL